MEYRSQCTTVDLDDTGQMSDVAIVRVTTKHDDERAARF